MTSREGEFESTLTDLLHRVHFRIDVAAGVGERVGLNDRLRSEFDGEEPNDEVELDALLDIVEEADDDA